MNGSQAGPDPPPGQEWVGTGRDHGRRLPADVYARTVREHQTAAGSRRQIDAAVAAATGNLDQRHEGAQVGATESLKSRESYQRKVADRYAQGTPVDDAIAQHDLHRYTYTFPPDRYVEGVRDCYQRLAEERLTPESGMNYWDCDWYKGINTVWRHEETGRPVEFQFHTPRSYEIKQETHPYYGVRRSPFLSDGETEVSGELARACKRRTAEAYQSTEPGRECEVPPGNESLWPDRFDRSQVGEPISDQALATVDREAAGLRQEQQRRGELPRQADGPGMHGAGQSGPPGLPESVRQRVRHDPAGLADWGGPGTDGRDRGRDRERG